MVKYSEQTNRLHHSVPLDLLCRGFMIKDKETAAFLLMVAEERVGLAVLTAASLSKRAKSSLRVITNSCAVHWDARLVKPSISANRMLRRHKDTTGDLTLQPRRLPSSPPRGVLSPWTRPDPSGRTLGFMGRPTGRETGSVSWERDRGEARARPLRVWTEVISVQILRSGLA